MGINTPWGIADYEKNLSGTYKGQTVSLSDILQVSTPSHGGIGMSVEAGSEILSEYAKEHAYKQSGYYWFEEDCDWCLPIIEFDKAMPNVIASQIVEDAKTTAKDWHSEYAF